MLHIKSDGRQLVKRRVMLYNSPCKLATFKEIIMHKPASAIGQLALLHDDSIADEPEPKIETPSEKRVGRKPKDLAGQRFGRLVAVELTGDRQHGGAVWLCRCDCGTTIKMAIASLRNGTKSCGCLGYGHNRYITRRGGVGSLQSSALTYERQLTRNTESLFDKYRRAALKRGYAWRLSFGEFAALIGQDCHYCGELPTQEHVAHKGTTDGRPVVYNGIDRVDNTRGYETGNVVPCCGVCNTAKLDRDKDEFLEWARRIAEHSRKEG
jgi:5-methylcytosine-specific restriction endonuclease McrA